MKFYNEKSIDLIEKILKKGEKMKKPEATAMLQSFYNRNLDCKMSEVHKYSNEGYYCVISQSKEVKLELWYEEWPDPAEKSKRKYVFAICFEYESNDLLSKDFPNWETYRSENENIYNTYDLPGENVVFLQEGEDSKTKKIRWYWGIYISPENEAQSLQLFFDNENFKSVFERYSINLSDGNGKKFTERIQQILARVGQGVYRENLEKLWNSACAVTGCQIREALRASHAKPWKDCKDKDEEQRLDGHNGLLLSANYDALFDKGLISFSPLKDGWKIMITPSMEQSQLELLGINKNACLNPPENLKLEDKEKIDVFLKYHREHIFKN